MARSVNTNHEGDECKDHKRQFQCLSNRLKSLRRTRTISRNIFIIRKKEVLPGDGLVTGEKIGSGNLDRVEGRDLYSQEDTFRP